MKHIALYNLEQHVVECVEEYEGDALVDDGTNAAKHNAWRLDVECHGRGTLAGEWKVYQGDVPFSWEIVTPKEAPSA